MRGYLSRIASQSGLSFSSKSRVPPSGVRGAHAGMQAEPLDREEVLMVQPMGELKSSEILAVKHERSTRRPLFENVSLKPDLKNTMDKGDPKQVSAPSTPEPAASSVGVETVFVGLEPESYQKKQDLSSAEGLGTMSTKSVSAESIAPTVGKPSTITEQHEERSADLRRAVFTEPEGSDIEPVKQYFTKTAEVIGGRVTEPAEVQTILLREIQEWVEAGTAPETAEETAKETATDKYVEPVALSSEPIETKDSVRITKPEVGGVRIGEKRPQPSTQEMASRIEEQSFDLSIGTISIVIEGDEGVPQSAPAPRADNRKNGYDTGHRRSRLGRNYL